VGAPPGYVGYDEGGQLTEAIRRKPYSVVLFDEIEKAHPDVFNALLQILEDGRLTDGKGRLVDFKNAIVIMTSNIGSQEILNFQEQGGDYEGMQEKVTALLRRHFRPEFLNRVDEVIVFRALEQSQLQQITALLLKRLAERLKKNAGFDLQWDDAVTAYLAQKGYDPSFGARPLKRLIQQEVETPLSYQIVKGEIKSGDTVTLTKNETGLQFQGGDGS